MSGVFFSLVRRQALALACVAVSVQALAASTFELRYFGLDTFTASSTTSSDDLFANGNPAVGLLFQTPTGPVSGLYGPGVGSFTSGAERAGPAGDWLGGQFGVGGLSYRLGDAADSTNNLTPSPYAARTLSLATTAVPATALGLADRQQGFNLMSLWNFSVPSLGESLSFGLGGSNAGLGSDGATNYRDRLQIRYTTNLSGVTSFNFELQTRQDGFFTRTALASRSLSSMPVELSQVDYLLFQLSREAPTAGDPNPGVEATVAFMDAAYDAANDRPVVLYGFSFPVLGTTFLDGRFSVAYNAATWLSPEPLPVPEPATAALWLAGLLLVGRRIARRR